MTFPRRTVTAIFSWLLLAASMLTQPAAWSQVETGATAAASSVTDTASDATIAGGVEAAAIPPSASDDGSEVAQAPEQEGNWACRPNEDGVGYICSESRPYDWYAADELPKEMQTRQCLRCNGRFVDPLSSADRSLAPDEAPLNGRSITTELEGDTLTLSGGVELNQSYREIRGDTLTYERVERSATVKGNIRLREPGILLQGEQATLNSETGEAEITNGEYYLHKYQLHGGAAELRRESDEVVKLKDGGFSFCAPEDDDWEIVADNIELDLDEGTGTARKGKLKVAGVPVLYLPYISFPLGDTRRTGVLWPSVGSGSRGGIDIAVPIYFNLKENYDLTYTPRIIERRGINNEGEFRYLGKNVGMWSVGGAYMAEDRKFVDEHPDQEREDRWLAQVQHNNLINQRWSSRVNYTEVSDPFYMKDLETSSIDTRRETSLRQQGNLDYLGDDWLLQVELQQFQSLADDIQNDYKKLPQVTGSYRNRNQPFELSPVLLAQYSNFDTDDDFRVTGERIYGELGLRYPMLWQYGFLNTEVKYRQLDYRLNSREDQNRLVNASPGAALAHIDGGLFFERETRLAGRPMIQTLEPRIAYLYSGYDDQRGNPDFDSSELTFNYNQLYRKTRFSGRDRIDDANQVSVGVTTRFLEGFTGEEYLSAYLGQIYYFEDRRVRLKAIDPVLSTSTSEWAAGGSWVPNEQFKLRTSVVYDEHTGKMNAANFNTRYKTGNGQIYNLGYSFRRALTNTRFRDTTDQVTFSSYLPLGMNWGLFGSVSYSLEQQTSVEDMFGFEYDTCCWRIRLLHMRYFDSAKGFIDFRDPNLQREESTQLQISLKGLGGFGSRVDSILEKMIRGYRRSDF